jgi:hypothetical protein
MTSLGLSVAQGLTLSGVSSDGPRLSALAEVSGEAFCFLAKTFLNRRA